MFRPTIFHFIIVFLIQLLAATPNKYILCYVMLCSLDMNLILFKSHSMNLCDSLRLERVIFLVLLKRLQSCYNKSVKSSIGYRKRHSVTRMLLEL